MEDDLSVPEAARVLGVRTQTVANMIERGELEQTREALLGKQRRVFVSRESVEAAQARRVGIRKESEA